MVALLVDELLLEGALVAVELLLGALDALDEELLVLGFEVVALLEDWVLAGALLLVGVDLTELLEGVL